MLAPRESACCLVIEVEAFEGDYCWVAEVPHLVRSPRCLSHKHDGIRNLSSRASCTFGAAPSPCCCRISYSASPSWQTFDRKPETASGLISSHITSIVGCDLRLLTVNVGSPQCVGRPCGHLDRIAAPLGCRRSGHDRIFEKAHSSRESQAAVISRPREIWYPFRREMSGHESRPWLRDCFVPQSIARKAMEFPVMVPSTTVVPSELRFPFSQVE